MKITWFGHSAFRIDLEHSVIMMDPFLANPTFNGDRLAAFKGATHVVLTHGHDDHIGNTVEICEQTGATLVANFELCMYLKGKGVQNVSPGNHGGTIHFQDFSVSFVPAWHSSSSMVDGVPVYLGNPAGIIITPKHGKTVYHMGDTDIFMDMQLIQEIHKPQIGLVPIGDRFTMGAKLAALACKRYFDFDLVLPMHYGTFPILDQSPEGFMLEMRDARAKVITPQRGEAVEL